MSTRLIAVVTTAIASTTLACLGLVYPRVNHGASDAHRQLVWVDRAGKASLLLHGGNNFYLQPRLSPNGTRLAVEVLGERGQSEVWVYQLDPVFGYRLAGGADPTWEPNGERIAFSAAMPPDLYWAAADGSNDPELLLSRRHAQFPSSWSPDGSALAFYEAHPNTGGDIWILASGTTASRFLMTNFSERAPQFSPNGQWLAYVSDESGRDEVYVRRVHGAGRPHKISIAGGGEAVWSPDGRELFYREGPWMMVVDVTRGPLEAGSPMRLFTGGYDWNYPGLPNYDVARDGTRFVMVSR